MKTKMKTFETFENIKKENFKFKDNIKFKKWFGDSKVVDEHGEPLIVYHGSDNEFNEFNPKTVKYVGSNGDGYYFSPDEYESKKYGKNIKEFYVSIKNPIMPKDKFLTEDNYKSLIDYIHDDDEYCEYLKNYGWFDDNQYEKFRDNLAKDFSQKDDYTALFDLTNTTTGSIQYLCEALKNKLGILRDGVISPIFREFVAFDSKQIKSVENNGNFDETNPNVYEKKKKIKSYKLFEKTKTKIKTKKKVIEEKLDKEKERIKKKKEELNEINQSDDPICIKTSKSKIKRVEIEMIENEISIVKLRDKKLKYENELKDIREKEKIKNENKLKDIRKKEKMEKNKK
jgi:hypothetical protein